MSDDRPVLLSGGCQCGAVRYALTAEPYGTHICHCRMCQLFSGAPVVAASAFPRKAVIFTQGNPKYYQSTHEHTLFYKSSLIAERGFCPNCGSSSIQETIDYP